MAKLWFACMGPFVAVVAMAFVFGNFGAALVWGIALAIAGRIFLEQVNILDAADKAAGVADGGADDKERKRAAPRRPREPRSHTPEKTPRGRRNLA